MLLEIFDGVKRGETISDAQLTFSHMRNQTNVIK